MASPDAVDDNIVSIGSVVAHTDDVAVGVIVEGVAVLEIDLSTGALGERIHGSHDSNLGILITNSGDLLNVVDSGSLALQAGQLSNLALGSFHGSDVAVIIGNEDEITLLEAIGLEVVGDDFVGDIAGFVGLGAVNVNVDGGLDLDVVVLVLDFLDHLGDLGEIGVDDDDSVVLALLVLVNLNELTLSAESGLSVGGLESVDISLGSGGSLNAVNISDGNLGFLLLAQILAQITGLELFGVSGNGLVVDGGGLVAAVVGPLGSRTAIGAVGGVGGQVEFLVTEGLVVLEGLAISLAVEAHGLVTERGGVGDHRSLGDRAEQQLGNELTGGRSVEVNALDVGEDASLLSVLSDVESPVSAGELIVLVVADGAQDHGEDFVARDVAGGLEGAVGIALDELSVGAVADVTGSPASAGHVAELVVRSVQARLVVLGEILSVDTIDDRSHLSAGDLVLGLEGTVLITLENTHTIEDGDSFSVIIVDLLVGLEGIGADGQRQSHDQSQHHCE